MPPHEREQALASGEGLVPFEPIPGRTMKEYIVVPETVYGDRARFKGLVRQSLDYVQALPPRQKSRGNKSAQRGEAAQSE